MLVRNQRQKKEDGNFHLSAPFGNAVYQVEQELSEVTVTVRSLENKKDVRTVHVSELRHAVLDELDNRDPDDVGTSNELFVIGKIKAHRHGPRGTQYLVEWSGQADKRKNTCLMPNSTPTTITS